MTAPLLDLITQRLVQDPPEALQQELGETLYQQLFARCLSVPPAEPRHAARINTIKSETTPRERALLFHLASRFWNGQGHVLEVGPFLGGTTRALAMGMLENPRRAADARLLTFDRFRAYYNGEALAQALEPQFQDGSLPSEARQMLTASGDFFEAFRLLHSSQDYWGLIDARVGVLPDLAETPQTAETLALPEDAAFGLVFVDGCKSWYATRWFLARAMHQSLPGTVYAFQDYGWHTCFWIPFFLRAFREDFRFLGRVDYTHVFQLRSPRPVRDIEEAFPVSPEQAGIQALETAFHELGTGALDRGDRETWGRHRLHTAAARAYLGDTERAESLLRALAEDEDLMRRCGRQIRLALEHPAYRPKGA